MLFYFPLHFNSLHQFLYTLNERTRYFTVKEVAKRLDVTEDWVRDLIQLKQLKAVKVGKWRVDPEELKKFIQRRTNIK